MSNLVSGEKKGTGISIFTVGGAAGFSFGPIVVTAALLMRGLKRMLVLIVPVAIMSLVLFTSSLGERVRKIFWTSVPDRSKMIKVFNINRNDISCD